VADLERADGGAAKLAAVLADPREDDLVRAQAAASLGRMPGGAQHAGTLIRAISDPSGIVRRDAAQACGAHRLPGAAEGLAGRLTGDRDPDVRRAAAVALGRIGAPASIDPLLAAMDDPEPGVQQLASESLETLTGQRFGRNARAWRAWAATRQPAPPPEGR